jgi:hypothetical protein
MFKKIGALAFGLLFAAGIGSASASTMTTFDYTGGTFAASTTDFGDHISASVTLNCNPCADGTYYFNNAMVIGVSASSGPYNAPAAALATYASGNHIVLSGGNVTNWSITSIDSFNNLLSTFGPPGGVNHDEACSYLCGEKGQGPSGTWAAAVAATPLPDAWTMMLIGLAALGLATYSRPKRRMALAA